MRSATHEPTMKHCGRVCSSKPLLEVVILVSGYFHKNRAQQRPELVNRMPPHERDLPYGRLKVHYLEVESSDYH